MQILPSALSIVWLVLVIPSTFAETIALQLKVETGNIYLHAQIFTGFMYIGAAACLWFLRAWKVGELEAAAAADADQDAAKREAEIRDDDAVPRRAKLARTVSVTASLKSKAKMAKGLWSWQRV